jgi:hypothetical protein
LYSSTDASEDEYVEQGAGSVLGVTSVFSAGGVGPSTDLACAYIPAVLAADEVFQGGVRVGCTRPTGDRVVAIPTGSSIRYVEGVEVPASVSDTNVPLNGSGRGTVAFALFTAQVFNGQSATGQAISCILPHAEASVWR